MPGTALPAEKCVHSDFWWGSVILHFACIDMDLETCKLPWPGRAFYKLACQSSHSRLFCGIHRGLIQFYLIFVYWETFMCQTLRRSWIVGKETGREQAIAPAFKMYPHKRNFMSGVTEWNPGLGVGIIIQFGDNLTHLLAFLGRGEEWGLQFTVCNDPIPLYSPHWGLSL